MRINKMLISVLALALPILSCASGDSATPSPVAPVQPVVAAVHVLPEAATALVGTNTPLTATITDAEGHPMQGLSVTWASSDPNIAAVSATGVVSASRVGTATIVASLSGKSGSSTVNVNSPAHDTIIVTPSAASMDVASTAQFSATVSQASGTPGPVVWSSSNPAIASVTAQGLVTAMNPGQAGITARVGSMVTTTTVTIILPHIATVMVSPAGLQMAPGAQRQMSATLLDAVGHPLMNRLVTWTSSNTTVATVTTNGLLTGILAGSITLTATAEGTTGSTTISVSATQTPPPPVTPPPVTPPTTTGLYDDYSAGSAPHFSHIQTQITDWRIQNLSSTSQRSSEYDWLVTHYDHAMGGLIDQQKSRMPTFTQIEYALYLTLVRPGYDPPSLASGYYADMQAWYAAHTQYNIEDAFLHDPGAPKSLASRRVGSIWGSQRWFINVADAGARVYQSDRMVRIVNQIPGFTRDGV
ncbi:MAG: Ig-like domain-containing protein, partial [Gemmatimonadota bacterium]|nr:Ig-like domain-containing protein [Gemmatimonadota bacterium]